MTPMEWIALATLGVLLCANLVGGVVGIVKLINCLNDRFAERDEKAEERHLEICERLTALESSRRYAPRVRRIQHAG